MGQRTTQLDRVVEKIARDGFADNFWAIENYILRLGAIIHTLRHEKGVRLVSAMGSELNVQQSHRKNCYYLTPEKYEEMLARTDVGGIKVVVNPSVPPNQIIVVPDPHAPLRGQQFSHIIVDEITDQTPK